MVNAKVFIYAKAFDGSPKETDFNLVVEELPALKDGEFLSEAIYLSVDPYMRLNAPNIPTGIPFVGQQIARIMESKNPDFPVGRLVVGRFGWRSHTITTNEETKDSAQKGYPKPYLFPDFKNLSPSLGLGILGMPGNAAYFGLLEILRPKVGETIVVSGAAGAVGSIVGQIAKIKGCKVIGIAGTDTKGKWLVDELGFDKFINYKTTADVSRALHDAAPQGVDCYFDNVGGPVTHAVIENMNKFGRVAVCGVISAYNDTDRSKAGINQFIILMKELTVQGFVVYRWLDRWMEGINQNAKWIEEGKLKYQETITEGFEKMPKAFIDMLNGGNVGKAIVKA